jgi:glucokinase
VTEPEHFARGRLHGAQRSSAREGSLAEADRSPLAPAEPGLHNGGVGSDRLVLGVDLGGTKVVIGAVVGRELGAVVEHPTIMSGSESLLNGIEAMVREASSSVGEPTAIGIGVGSQIEFATGTVLSSVNIPLAGVPLREVLGSRLGLPVYVDSDVNCAALAEAELLDADNLVMLTLGIGVDGGVVIGGRIFRGTHGLGAQLGHVSVSADGPPCPGSCPNRGCLDALCSVTALERDATELAKARPNTRLGRVYAQRGQVTGPDVAAAARDGDPEACTLFDLLGRWLGVGIAGYVNVFEPEHVLIGGQLSSVADLFLDRAREEAGSRALPTVWERVRGVSPARRGTDAGVIGAGLLAAREVGADCR